MSASPHPAFEGSLVRLRLHEPADVPVLNGLFNEPEVLEGIGPVFPQAVTGYREFVESARGQEDRIFFVIERLDDGSPIGGCGLMDMEPAVRKAVFGIWLGRSFWDAGYGTDATRTACRFGFRYLNLQRIELNVFASNPRAVRTYEKVGFAREGTRRRDGFVGGRYVDSYLMSLLAEEFED